MSNQSVDNIEEIFSEIDNKKSWNKYPAKQYLNKLYILKKNAINTNNIEQIKKIDIYIDYVKNILDQLDSLLQNIFSMIGTIFIPLSFIVGFFGMNFKSMGSPSLKKGIYNINHAQHKLAALFLFIIIITISFYIKILEVF